ncbi:restriction endonuclease subunit S [Olivibacter ginsenosidimutans]|uniref:Restriction endonuclease subunit S n=1 Tax=Olivibacter ginsenosidimutans TaxID=1176537 RepID=A0ABP9BXD6_9SPHI
MNKTLPKGWVTSKLKHLGQYLNGRAFKPTEWKPEGIPIVRIQNLNNLNAPFNYTDETYEEKYSIENGDLLMAWSASLGVYFWERGYAWLNQHIFKVLYNEKIVTKRFLYYCLLVSIDDFYGKTHGTGMVHITKPIFENHEVSLPPLPEQERIVAKLDKLFAQHEKIKAALNRIPQLLKTFRQQVLTQAVTGKLTAQWREGKDLEKWKTPTLKDVCFNFKYGSSSKSEEVGKVAVLRMGNLQNGRLDLSDLKYSNSKAEIEKYTLLPGDVLFNRTNSPELVGKTSIYKGEIPAIYAGYLIKIENNKSVLNSDYLNFYMNTHRVKVWCNEVKTDGVSQSNINAQKLAGLEIPLPPLEEQQEIVRRVESLFAKADAIEARYLTLKAKIDSLPQSILHKAFKGELVPQLPTDGDAKDLLAEIMALKKISKGGSKTDELPNEIKIKS